MITKCCGRAEEELATTEPDGGRRRTEKGPEKSEHFSRPETIKQDASCGREVGVPHGHVQRQRGGTIWGDKQDWVEKNIECKTRINEKKI